MNIFKKLLLGFVSLLFIALLFTTAFDVGLARIITHPDNIKKLVSGSGLYSSLVPSVLQQTKTIETNVGTISTTDTVIVKAANDALTPQFVQQNTEKAIDSVYAWLNGETAQPDFAINLNDVKTKFANNVSTAVEQKLSGLPTCTAQQAAAPFDPVNATCLPPGVTAKQVAAEVGSSLNGDKGFLENPTISAATIKNGDSNQSLFADKLKNVPEQYQKAKKLPLVLSILTIITAAGVVFLSVNWQKGLKHAGIVLVVIGVVMMLFAWSSSREVNKQLVPNIKAHNLLLQKDLRNLATELTQQISKNYWFFGGLYALLGTGAIVAGETFRRRGQTAHYTPAEKPDADQSKPAPEVKPAEDPSKPKSKPKK